MSRRGVLWLVGLGVLLVLAALLAGPGASAPLASSPGPEGTLALHRFLTAMGHEVADGDPPTDPSDVLFLLADLRIPEETEPILEWVAAGGRLVLADPQSVIAEQLGVGPADTIGGFALREALSPSCVAPEAVGVERIAVLPTDVTLNAGAPEALGCFPQGEGTFQVTLQVGVGEVVVLGGASPLTNELLRYEDNAAYALRLTGGRTRVVFGDPLPPGAAAGRSGGIWDALPTPARIGLVQVLLAALLIAVAKGRRLGMPLPEEAIAPIPAGELVRATGRLYRSARASDYAGELLRRRAVGRLTKRLGLTPSPETEPLVRAVAASLGRPEDRAREALAGPEPTNDQELIALSNELDELVQRSEEARR